MTLNTALHKNLLKQLLSDFQVEVKLYDSVTSTNDIAKEVPTSDILNPVLIVSNHQTRGRGRMNRQFISPPAAGIYMSLLLPALPLDKLLLATPAAAVAAAEAIAELTASNPKIKWVNDIYLEEKKIGGILTEAISDYKKGNISHIVVGIGINCIESGIPSDERNLIGSLNAPDLNKNLLVATICKKLLNILDQIKSDDISFMDKYRQYSNLIGKTVTVYKTHLREEGSIDATAIDIDHSGNLVVKYRNGTIEHLSSGEVSVKFN